MSDSCGIFFVSTPGVYTLKKGVRDLHDRDRTGVLARGFPKSADLPNRPRVADIGDDYDRIEKDGGPGQPLLCYLPRAEMDMKKKLGPSLIPSDASAAVAASAWSDRAQSGFKVREKRLQADIWKCNGEHYKGSHFPICVFTNNVGRRSPERLTERMKHNRARRCQDSQWRKDHQGQQWWGTRSQTEATWIQPSEARSAGWQADSSRMWQDDSSRWWQAEWQADSFRWS